MRRTATLGAPRLPRTLIPRPRLWEELDRASKGAVTVLVAPAGAGKTLGVSGWLHDRVHADATWVHADAAWGPARLEDVLVGSSARADGANPGIGTPRMVVVDDAHLLPPASVRLVDRLLNTAPESLRLLLLTRWDLPLSRMVPELLGHCTTLRSDVLRMDTTEVAAVVTAQLGTVDPALVDAIAHHANGWCAAVVLTAHAVAAAPEPVAAAVAFARGETRIADRVATEVFAALRPRDRHVLLCLAGEGLVSAATAVHLSGDSQAAEVLARFEEIGLLVTRVDVPSGAVEPDPHYRTHPLLAEVVRRRLVMGGDEADRARTAVARAVDLDLERGESDRAFDRLVTMHAVDAAVDVLAAKGAAMVMRGERPAFTAFANRHAEVIDARPDTWFTIALDRWVDDEVETARQWLDRLLDRVAAPRTSVAGWPDPTEVACARLMRARLGAGSLADAVDEAQRTVDEIQRANADPELLPMLLTELGATQNWTGDLPHAVANLTSAIELSRHRGLSVLAAVAASHVALTEYVAGHERASMEMATEALSLLGEALPRRVPFAAGRAALALLLSGLVDPPWPTEPIDVPEGHTAVHSADLCTRFWFRIRDARLALITGTPADAEWVLTRPLGLPVVEERLPRHLHVAILVEHALLAALAADQARLRELSRELAALHARGETALVEGLRADVAGRPRAAVEAFETAAKRSAYDQPPSQAIAWACQAQLLDARGDHDAALERLREAVRTTEVRRNAVPFLGWVRQGSPIAPLLARLAQLDGGGWLQKVAAAGDRPDVVAMVAPTTATHREHRPGADIVVRPTLSPRERDVLRELSRGATYADIAAALFVSENTVKTHVSNLYGKLAVSRRSEALATARSLHLL